MRILLIHQYFLEKNDGGGSRFNELTKIWSQMGHHTTVIAGMVHYNTGVKHVKYKGKFFHKDAHFHKNVDVIRCHVSEIYNLNFIGRLWAYFSFVFSSLYAGLFKTNAKFDLILVTSPPLFRDLWPESAIDTGVLKNKLIIKFAYLF